MIKDTNFQMLRNFDYTPVQYGICTSEEADMIRKHFRLKERSDVELQNFRDFAVLYLGSQMDRVRTEDMDKYMKLSDMMSAITGVVDSIKFSRGLGV